MKRLWRNVGNNGIEFDYCSDRVLWVWPWRRKYNNYMPFHSLNFNRPYLKLKDLRKDWDFYIQRMRDEN